MSPVGELSAGQQRGRRSAVVRSWRGREQTFQRMEKGKNENMIKSVSQRSLRFSRDPESWVLMEKDGFSSDDERRSDRSNSTVTCTNIKNTQLHQTEAYALTLLRQLWLLTGPGCFLWTWKATPLFLFFLLKFLPASHKYVSSSEPQAFQNMQSCLGESRYEAISPLPGSLIMFLYLLWKSHSHPLQLLMFVLLSEAFLLPDDLQDPYLGFWTCPYLSAHPWLVFWLGQPPRDSTFGGMNSHTRCQGYEIDQKHCSNGQCVFLSVSAQTFPTSESQTFLVFPDYLIPPSQQYFPVFDFYTSCRWSRLIHHFCSSLVYSTSANRVQRQNWCSPSEVDGCADASTSQVKTTQQWRVSLPTSVFKWMIMFPHSSVLIFTSSQETGRGGLNLNFSTCKHCCCYVKSQESSTEQKINQFHKMIMCLRSFQNNLVWNCWTMQRF